MSKNLKYIDKLAESKIRNHKDFSHQAWENFSRNPKFLEISKQHVSFSKFTSLVSVKSVTAFISIIILSTLAYFFKPDTTKTKALNIIPKTEIEKNIARKPIFEYIKQKNETVLKPKIKEPTVVVIKKQVIVRDTVYINEGEIKK